MNDQQISTFLAVCKNGSFSSAEDELYISKQAMFKQINSLEEEIGFPLFIRKHNGVKLTKQGEMFRQGMIKLIDEKNRLITECRDLDHHRMIRIGNTEHQVLLDPVNLAFHQKHPDIEMQRTVNPNHSGEWRVENGIQDVAETFNIDIHTHKNTGFIPLTVRPYMVLMRKDHPLSSKKCVSLSDLTAYQTVIYPLMMKREYTDEMKHAFENAEEKLLLSDDVDHQVEMLYRCMNDSTLMISANPFTDRIADIASVPLSTGWNIEYGILYRHPLSHTVELYIETAREVYRSL